MINRYLNLLTVLILFTVSYSNAQKTDSIIIFSDSSGSVRILNEGNENEYRFYNSQGFFSFSIWQLSNGKFLAHNNEVIISYKVKPDFDPVFLSDTFPLGFVNRLRNEYSGTIQNKFSCVARDYYSPQDLNASGQINSFYDNLIKQNEYNVDTFNNPSVSINGDKVFVSWGAIVNDLPEHWCETIRDTLLQDIEFTRRERAKLDNVLIFKIISFTNGEIAEVILVSDVNQETRFEIESRISTFSFDKLITRQARPSRFSHFISAIYIDISEKKKKRKKHN